MKTETLRINCACPEPELIVRAAEALRGGALVAFPTETVYGLGALALKGPAVRKIFEAKGRPASNPLIVHVADVAGARRLASEWPITADRLAQAFWPGPLTLVVPARDEIIGIVTAGGPTVALRVPAHPVALALLRACDAPLAAPSANRSTAISPTCAEHVEKSLGGRIDLILDAGPCSGGLESTVLDVTTDPPRILRPGLVIPAQLEEFLLEVGLPCGDGSPTMPSRSPGTMARHYAPRTPLELSDDGLRRVQELARSGTTAIGWLTSRKVTSAPFPGVAIIDMPTDIHGYGAKLYQALHDLDERGLERIIVDAPPRHDDWLAIHDRLRRAAQ